MDKSLNELINDAFKKYARDQIKDLNKMDLEEARLLFEIKKDISPKLIKMGDIRNHMPMSKRKYDKIVELIKDSKNRDDSYIIWDDLIQIDRLNGEV